MGSSSSKGSSSSSSLSANRSTSEISYTYKPRPINDIINEALQSVLKSNGHNNNNRPPQPPSRPPQPPVTPTSLSANRSTSGIRSDYQPRPVNDIKNEALQSVLKSNGHNNNNKPPQPPVPLVHLPRNMQNVSTTTGYESTTSGYANNRNVSLTANGRLNSQSEARSHNTTVSPSASVSTCNSAINHSQPRNVPNTSTSTVSGNVNGSQTGTLCSSNDSDLKRNNFNSHKIKNSSHFKNKNNNKEVSSKHEVFLKKLVASFNVYSSTRNRGFYCSVCDKFEIRFKKENDDKTSHNETEEHQNNVKDKTDVKRYYCPKCKAHFFGDITFWVDHINMDLHKFFAEKKIKRSSEYKKNNIKRQRGRKNANKKCEVSEINKPLNRMPSLPLFDALTPQDENSYVRVTPDLIFKQDIIENILRKLSYNDKGNYCFYCYNCELWTDDETKWKSHNEIHANNVEFKKTVKNCSRCRLMIIGNNALKEFHSNDESHEAFEKLLVAKSSHLLKDKNCNPSTVDESSDDSEEEEDDDDVDDDNEGSSDTIGKKKTQLLALLLKDLPPNTTRDVVFHAVKDFGRVDKVHMNFDGPNSAKINFKFRFTAVNIVNNGFPITIKGQKVETSLAEL